MGAITSDQGGIQNRDIRSPCQQLAPLGGKDLVISHAKIAFKLAADCTSE